MGLFGGKSKDITINIPEIKLPSAEELISASTNQYQQSSPLAFGAREGALSDLGQGSQFYQQFQPTSIEQALGNQYFQNIIPDLEKSIKNNLSLSGVATSPILSRQIADARGQVGYDVGSFLANQGNQRAQYSLSSRLGIDPYSTINQWSQMGMNNAYQQAQLQRERDLQLAQVEMANQIKNQQPSGLGRLIGAGVGAIAAPFTGGLSLLPAIGMGSSLGGLLEGDFGAMDALGLIGGIGSMGNLGFTNPFASTASRGAGIGGIGGVNAMSNKDIGELLALNIGR